MPLRPRNRKKPRLRETTVTHNSVFAADRLKCRPRNAFGTGIFLSNSEPRTTRLCLKLWRGARGFRRVAVADRGKITRRSACASRVGQRALALANFFHLLFPQLSTINYLQRGHSSVGRAPALQAGSQGFESPCLQSTLAAQRRA